MIYLKTDKKPYAEYKEIIGLRRRTDKLDVVKATRYLSYLESLADCAEAPKRFQVSID